jgi:hypothetical protein
MLNICQSVS